jgi:Zn-finger nucleic acid-binding protein
MQCPVDQNILSITERQGIEIDYCPKCRGVWLDRGELDKLIEAGSGQRSEAPRSTDRPLRDEDRRFDSDDRYKYEKKRKKESFLSDLFDF